MKKLIIFSAMLVLSACGPSPQEIKETVIITCNIMGESKNMDSAFRIKEINAARKKIGAPAFLESDSVIKEAFKYGLCEKLVENSPVYDSLLNMEKESEAKRKRIAAEKEAERERIAAEKEAERETIAAEKAAKRVREERKKEAERQRIAKEKFNKAVDDYFTAHLPKPRIVSSKIGRKKYGDGLIPVFDVEIDFSSILGFISDVTFHLDGNLGSVTENVIPVVKTMHVKPKIFPDNIHDALIQGKSVNLEKVTITLTGEVYHFLNRDLRNLDYTKYDPKLNLNKFTKQYTFEL